MNLKNKIEIDILEFIRVGKFDYIKLGKTKEWIINNFPDSDDNDYNFNIWRYGNIEFHFYKEQLYCIFSDYVHELNGGKSIKLNKWILNEPDRLTLLYVIQKLNEEKIDFMVINNKKLSDIIEIEINESGVRLGFIDPDGNIINSNQYILNSFSLYNQLW